LDIAGERSKTLFSGWALVGLSSALLVGFIHERTGAGSQ